MLSRPVVNLRVFEREVYMLSALLVSDEKLLAFDEVIDVAALNYNSEVNRLFVFLAAAARQIMGRYRTDAEVKKIKERQCGERWKDSRKKGNEKPDALDFLQACHSIVHATELTATNAHKVVNERMVNYYQDRVRILEEERGKGIKPATDLDGMEFAVCCILLSRRAQKIQRDEIRQRRQMMQRSKVTGAAQKPGSSKTGKQGNAGADGAPESN